MVKIVFGIFRIFLYFIRIFFFFLVKLLKKRIFFARLGRRPSRARPARAAPPPPRHCHRASLRRRCRRLAATPEPPACLAPLAGAARPSPELEQIRRRRFTSTKPVTTRFILGLVRFKKNLDRFL